MMGMGKSSTAWYDAGWGPELPDWNALRHGLLLDAVLTSRTMRDMEPAREGKYDEVLQLLTGWMAKRANIFEPYRHETLPDDTSSRRPCRAHIWFWKDGYMEFRLAPKDVGEEEDEDEPDRFFMDVASNDPTEFEELRTLIEEHTTSLTHNSRRAQLYSVVMGRRGQMEIRRVGSVREPLIRENYSPEVLASFDRSVVGLTAKKPLGRLIVMTGPPGTGKTYAIRGLMSACPKLSYVLVQAASLMKLAGPDLLHTLTMFREEEAEAICLVVEDADAILADRSRSSKAIDAMSALLNMGDGLLGTALDIRLIVTTNAPLQEIDEAILRPGRLMERIHIEALKGDQVNVVLRRLSYPHAYNENISMTLAECYALAAKGKQA